MGNVSELHGGSHENRMSYTVEAWYKQQTGSSISKKKYTYIVGKNKGEISALLLYSDYTGHSITLDVCAPKALTKGLIKEMWDYPFNQLKVQKVFGFIDQRNKLSQSTFERMGCRLESTLEDFFGPGIDRLVYAATKEDVIKWVT